MDRYRVPFYGAAVALAVSLVAHARAAFDEPGAVATAPTASITAAENSASRSTATSSSAARNLRCCVELEKCRRSSWDIALKAMRGDAKDRAQRRAKSREEQPTKPIDPDLLRRREALCALSEEFFNQLWNSQRDMAMALMKDFGSEGWVDNWVDFKSDELGEMLELSDSQQQIVSQGYDSLWRQHGPRMQKLLERQPPDYDALLRSAQDYFRDEDQLLANVLGEEARSKYADSQLETRAIITAALGAFAGKGWDQSIAW